MRPIAWPLGVLGAAAAGLAYASLYEVRAFTMREVTVPVLPAGSDPFRILHLSDAHMTPSQHHKQQWLRSLAELEPDLVVNTGDNLAHLDALPSVLNAYGDLLDLPGVFVFGSNDYYSPVRKNPALYLVGGTGTSSGRNEWWRTRTQDLPFEPMRRAWRQHRDRDLAQRERPHLVQGCVRQACGGGSERAEGPGDRSHAPTLEVACTTSGCVSL